MKTVSTEVYLLHHTNTLKHIDKKEAGIKLLIKMTVSGKISIYNAGKLYKIDTEPKADIGIISSQINACNRFYLIFE